MLLISVSDSESESETFTEVRSQIPGPLALMITPERGDRYVSGRRLNKQITIIVDDVVRDSEESELSSEG